MQPDNPLASESEEVLDRPELLPFVGTIDQLIGYNLAQLREDHSVSQSDIATMFERITGRTHSRNWVSLRETGQQPFTVADLIILGTIFKVSILRFLMIDRVKGMVWVDGLMKPVETFQQDLLVSPARTAEELLSRELADLVEMDSRRGKGDVKGWAQHLRSTRDAWLPWVRRTIDDRRNVFLRNHEPHPGAGKRRHAWEEMIDERKRIIKEVLHAARTGQALEPQNLTADHLLQAAKKGHSDGDDQEN
jgi:transcriptional regulator with XRE-family HTH domain